MAKPSYLDPDVSTIYYDDETGEVVNELGAPTGTIAYFSLASAPDGWIKANGATISRTTYDKLFTAIGTTYGAGDGSTTFVLPDLRGEFIRSLDDGAGVDTGRGLGTTQAASVESHQHNLASGTYTVTNPIGGDGTIDASQHVSIYDRTISSAAVQSYGGTETRPRNLALLACIKY